MFGRPPLGQEQTAKHKNMLFSAHVFFTPRKRTSLERCYSEFGGHEITMVFVLAGLFQPRKQVRSMPQAILRCTASQGSYLANRILDCPSESFYSVAPERKAV